MDLRCTGVRFAVCKDRCWASGGHVNRHAPAQTFEMTKGGGRRGRSCEKRSKKNKKIKAPLFSQGPLTDTKSVFVCLPGCQIKEFLCVGGSDRVYLTLQLLL